MGTSAASKLKIKTGDQLLVLNAPQDFKTSLGELPPGVTISSSGKNYNQVHWFVLNRAQMEKELSKLMKLLKEGVTIWVYYPKGSSKIQTDLTRDKGWDCLQKEEDKLTWISLVSFDATWSVFGFRPKTTADKKKENNPKNREIFNWIDAAAKTVRIPGELAAAFKKNKKAAAFFNELSFTNKKEYIEWIVTAKKEETKLERITGTIERLEKGWKNPRNM